MEPDEEFIDIELRSAEEVARRCIVLTSLLQIAAFDLGQPGLAVDDLETTSFDLREWLRDQDLWRELSSTEAIVFERPLIQRSEAVSIDPFLLGESMAALGWAIGAVPGMSPLQPSSLEEIVSQVPEPWDSPHAWVQSQRLRPELEIASQREAAELWSWRLDTELARREAPIQDRRDIDASITDVRSEAIGAGLLPADLPQRDLDNWNAISQIESDDLTSLRAMTEQRLKALNWVCGFGENWDDVPLEIGTSPG